LQLTARAGESVDTQNFIGFDVNAKDGADLRDVASPPPVPGSRLELRLLGQRWGEESGYYAKDIRRLPLTKRQVFDLEVECRDAGTPVTLGWANFATVPKEIRLTLVDIASGKRIYMRTSTGYTFTAQAGVPRRFQVIVDPARGTPMRVQIGEPTTITRAQSGLTLPVQLSREAMIEVKIRTLSGRVIHLLPAQNGREGINILRWDLRDRLGRLVPRGTYLIEVVAVTDENQVGRGVRTVHIR
jgi:hypothetical protein